MPLHSFISKRTNVSARLGSEFYSPRDTKREECHGTDTALATCQQSFEKKYRYSMYITRRPTTLRSMNDTKSVSDCNHKLLFRLFLVPHLMYLQLLLLKSEMSHP